MFVERGLNMSSGFWIEAGFGLAFAPNGGIRTCCCDLIADLECNQCEDPNFTHECWEIAIAGVTNGACSDCDSLDGIYLVQHVFVFGDCIWAETQVPVSDPFCPNSMGVDRYEMNQLEMFGLPSSVPGGIPNNGVIRIRIEFISTGTESIVYYIIPESRTFDCDGPNEFELSVNQFSTNSCASWPDTITAIPAECP
jgi:hypothetical protein